MSNPRKPAALKILEGNPGKRPIPVEPEPTGEVQKPRGLNRRAAQVWDEFAPICVEMGTLKSPDVHQFAVWCRLAAKSETRFGSMSVAELTEMRRIGDSFGMSAQGRARLGKVPKKTPANPFEKLA